jgi:hypothetical protein
MTTREIVLCTSFLTTRLTCPDLPSEWPPVGEPGQQGGVCDAGLAPDVHDRETVGA